MIFVRIRFPWFGEFVSGSRNVQSEFALCRAYRAIVYLVHAQIVTYAGISVKKLKPCQNFILNSGKFLWYLIGERGF